jgi:hypothetical protein
MSSDAFRLVSHIKDTIALVFALGYTPVLNNLDILWLCTVSPSRHEIDSIRTTAKRTRPSAALNPATHQSKLLVGSQRAIDLEIVKAI